MNFKELGLSETMVVSLNNLGITEPTEIQQKVLPLAMQGKDLVGTSETGSGKTLAFGAPILARMQKSNHVQALVIAPTRELAEQIAGEFKKFGRNLDYNVVSIYGGVSLLPQMDKLRNADIVVGTPGRLLDHMERRNLNLSKVKFLVLDEADKMVEMGFVEDVERIISQIPKDKQMFLFGATITNEVEGITKRHAKNPEYVNAKLNVDEALLEQYYFNVDQNEKFSLLVHLLKNEDPNLAIVFCGTRTNTDIVSKNLERQGFDASAIHGGLSQNQRNRVIEGFHKGNPHILVATAVAARGLDIKNVTHIFNYDVPKDPKEYVHRIGRTARAGDSGKAFTLLSQRDHEFFSSVLRHCPVEITKLAIGEFEKVKFDSGRNRGGFVSRGGFGGGFSRGRPSQNRFGQGREGFGQRSSGHGPSGFSREGSSQGGFGSRQGGFNRGGESSVERGSFGNSRSGARGFRNGRPHRFGNHSQPGFRKDGFGRRR
jgi:ATP-dependent RNA helicase DeaD